MVGKFAVVGVVAAAGLLLGGCKCNCGTEKTTAAASEPARVQDASAQGKVLPVNTMCPLGKHAFNAQTRNAETSRTYKGSVIGFCCEDCSEKFDTMSAAQKDEVLSAAKANRPL